MGAAPRHMPQKTRNEYLRTNLALQKIALGRSVVLAMGGDPARGDVIVIHGRRALARLPSVETIASPTHRA